MSKNVKIDENFYINEIGVLDWLKDNASQKIRFSDRYEYKENNKLHREDGPAIEYFSGIGNQFYIKGDKLSNEDWMNFKRTQLINKVLDASDE